MTPVLYLVRHADAAEARLDAERPLSKRGYQQIVELAEFLRRSGAFRPEEIWHSPLLRAVQTAEQLSHALKLHARQRTLEELVPEAAPSLVARKIAAASMPLALVGHEPHLSALASLLVAGEVDPAVFAMKKAAVLALEPAGHRWSVRWHVSPEIIA